MESGAYTTYSVVSREDLRVVVSRIKGELAASDACATVLALHGELGAGKTAFVQELASLLGVREHVTSPTFVIMKSYETADDTFPTLVHIDAYRIEHADELRPLRLGELFAQPRTLVCIEWAERLGDALPSSAAHLSIDLQADGTRTLTYAIN